MRQGHEEPALAAVDSALLNEARDVEDVGLVMGAYANFAESSIRIAPSEAINPTQVRGFAVAFAIGVVI